ncbi:MAG: hypothetical protein OTJ98_04145 [Dehalococcoidia bacterium]|nr:hypothetical protein [Dehalococcoidia bacterium]
MNAPVSGHVVGLEQREGEVFDLGYRHYDGPRGGRGKAFMAVYDDGIRSVLGLGRGVAAKMMCGIFGLLVLGPAIFIISVAGFMSSFGGETDEIPLPKHEDYYVLTFIILLLFAAIVGPALLSPDKRNSVLSLYAVRPLKSLDYAIARWLAFFTFAMAFTIVPQALLYLSFVLSDDSPLGYIKDHGRDLWAIFAIGLILAAFMTSLAMAAASLTSRRAFASAGVIAFVFITAAIGGFGGEILTSDQDREEHGAVGNYGDEEVQAPDGDAAHYIHLLILPDTMIDGVSRWTFGDRAHFPVSPWYSAMTIAAVIAGAFGITVFRYRKFGG